LATALAAIKGSSKSAEVCYGCGKPDHRQRDCLALKGHKTKAPTLCPWCHKGWHFAIKCCSKYDSEGCLIQGNQSQSVGWRRRVPTQIPRLPPWMPLQVPPLQVCHAVSPQVVS
ncbi:GA113 protein, partial [Buphagus erythrorhynchus]|nr:GA113 protein [Buphagus erythrorhynchus]NXU06100.1 GA113 protein [Buphagus erythrorhynchus]